MGSRWEETAGTCSSRYYEDEMNEMRRDLHWKDAALEDYEYGLADRYVVYIEGVNPKVV